MELEGLVRIVGRSLVTLQGMTQPASFEELGSLWWFRNATSQNVLLSDQALMPNQVLSAARDVGIARRVVIHQFLLPDTSEVDLIQRYEDQGFRLHSRQYLMRHELKPSTIQPSSWNIFQVEDLQQAKRVSSAAKQELLTEQHLPPAPLGVRLYAAQTSDQVIAWGRITQVQLDTVWVSDLYTKPAFRRRGVMAALLQKCDQELFDFGVSQMMLLCSETNQSYYLNLGYETLAIKLRFVARLSVPERLGGTLKTILKRLLR